METTHDFSSNFLKLLVRTRLDMEAEFKEGRKKRSILWGKILETIKEKKPGNNMPKEQISRKFVNLLTTYKRIKQRNNTTGRDASSWEFYNDFDEIYGTRHSIVTPPENLQSSLSCNDESNAANEDNLDDTSGSPGATKGAHCSRSTKRRKVSGSSDEMLDFFKGEAEKEEKRHAELVELERQKMAIERDRIQAMISVRDLLQKVLEK